MAERMIQANGVELCTEAFGKPDDPAVLLIMGATASMIRWEDEFCRRLAGQGRFVVRFDSRDTGKSVAYDLGAPGYDVNDLVDDAAGVLDAYGIDVAHVVGLSLGGVVTQRLTMRYPARVASITLMMTNPDGVELPDVDVMTEEMITHMTSGWQLDWSDPRAATDFIFEQWRLCTGASTRVFDEARGRQLAERDVARSANAGSALNHAAIAVDPRPGETIESIHAPTLVIHGTEDPVLAYAYGVACIDAIPGATLLTLEGAGHELHVDDWDAVIAAIAAHTASFDAPT